MVWSTVELSMIGVKNLEGILGTDILFKLGLVCAALIRGDTLRGAHMIGPDTLPPPL